MYDINNLIKNCGFKNFNDVASYLLQEFSNTDDYGKKMEVVEFAKRNNIDIIGLVTGEKTVEFYTQPTMTQAEIKENIEQITEPEPLAKPVNDKVKEILE